MCIEVFIFILDYTLRNMCDQSEVRMFMFDNFR